MTNVTSTSELYDFLCSLDIPVLDAQGASRDFKDIVDDLIGSYAMCSHDQRLMLIDSLVMMKNSGYSLSATQENILGYIKLYEGYDGPAFSGRGKKSETESEKRPKKKAKRDPDPDDNALVDFLKSFKIVGGDAT